VQQFDVAGTVQMTGFKMPPGASDSYVLTSDASGVGTWQAAPGGMGGGGTTNYIPKFTAPFTLGTSVIYETENTVGIGTTSPIATLHVQGDAIVKSTGGSVGLSGGNGCLEVWGKDGAFIDLRDSEGEDYDIRFTQISGTNNLNILGGNVGLGIWNPGYKLHVIGDIAYTGNIYDVSDIRLKENITPLENAIEKVSSIRGIYFTNTGEPTEKREVGVAAQEVEKVLPEVVSEDAKGYKSVDYSKLTPVLIEAVKEQQAQIEELKAEIIELRAKVK
jgi:hypothetical protein